MIAPLDKLMAEPGEVWASDHAGAVVMVLARIEGNVWVSHRVLVLYGRYTHFITGHTREICLPSASAKWERVS